MIRTSNAPRTKDDRALVPRSSLSRAALRGLVWLILQSLGGRLIGLVSQLALAWILSPSSFGLIGLVYAVTSLSAALVNFGVDDVLLQRENTLRFWVAPAFWTSLALSLVGFLITAALAPIGALYYGAGEIRSLAIIAALGLPLGALQTVPMVILRTRMDFRTMSIFNVAELAAVQAGTVLLALMGAGAYSFVLPGPVVAAVKLAALWHRAPPKVFRRFRSAQVEYLLSSGTAVFMTRLIIAAVAQGGYIILGSMASTVELGLYFFAFKLAAQPLWLLASNFSGVLFPTLVKLRSEPERQLAAALTTARLLSFAIMPFCFLQAALTDPALKLLFGTKWLAAIPVMQWLSVGLAFDAVTWITGSLLTANREYNLALRYTAAFSPLFFVFVLIGARYGQATGAAAGTACFYAIMGPWMSYLVFKNYGVGAGHLLGVFVRPTLLAGATIGAATASAAYLPDLLRAVQIGVVGPMFYAVAVSWFEPAILSELAWRVIPRRAPAIEAISAKIRCDLRYSVRRLFKRVVSLL